MTALAVFLAYVFAGAAVVLFLGGMLHASWEHYQDRKAGRPLTFPGWSREHRDALKLEKDRYRAPGRTGWVMWPLVAVGRPDLAERYLERRSARLARRRA